MSGQGKIFEIFAALSRPSARIKVIERILERIAGSGLQAEDITTQAIAAEQGFTAARKQELLAANVEDRLHILTGFVLEDGHFSPAAMSITTILHACGSMTRAEMDDYNALLGDHMSRNTAQELDRETIASAPPPAQSLDDQLTAAADAPPVAPPSAAANVEARRQKAEDIIRITDLSGKITFEMQNVQTYDWESEHAHLYHEIGPGRYHISMNPSGRPENMRPGEVRKIPSVLPAPPSPDRGPDLMLKWLEGGNWHPGAIAFKVEVPDAVADDLMEIQSALYSDPELIATTYKTRKPINMEQEMTDSRRLSWIGRGSISAQPFTYMDGMLHFAESVTRYLREYEAESAEFLRRVGAQLQVDSFMVDVVTAALATERYYMNDGPANADQGEVPAAHSAIGTNMRLDRPVVMDRALYLHFTQGEPLSSSCITALVEFRHAQFIRATGIEVTPQIFDAFWLQDPGNELREIRQLLAAAESPEPA